MIATKETIQAFIPQGPPFVMIDELISSDETRSCSTLEVRADNIFVADGQLQEPALLENIAQTAAARAGYMAKQENQPMRLGFIGAVKNFEVTALPRLGDKLETEVTIENQVFDVTIITGKVWCRGQLLAQCEMKIFISSIKQP